MTHIDLYNLSFPSNGVYFISSWIRSVSWCQRIKQTFHTSTLTYTERKSLETLKQTNFYFTPFLANNWTKNIAKEKMKREKKTIFSTSDRHPSVLFHVSERQWAFLLGCVLALMRGEGFLCVLLYFGSRRLRCNLVPALMLFLEKSKSINLLCANNVII